MTKLTPKSVPPIKTTTTNAEKSIKRATRCIEKNHKQTKNEMIFSLGISLSFVGKSSSYLWISSIFLVGSLSFVGISMSFLLTALSFRTSEEAGLQYLSDSMLLTLIP